MKKKIALLFDLDGTLLDTLEDLCDAVNFTMRKFNSPERTLEEVRRFLGHGAADLIAKSLKGGRDNPEYDAALAYFKKYYAAHADIKTRPYDGVIDILKKLGMPSAFDSKKADFSKMATSPAGNLVIGRVGHNTHILLNENGTKAGAATYVEMKCESMAEPPNYRELRFDRPFIYVIYETDTGLPLFIGTVREF